MPRQITDEEYGFLQARKQVADFVESIYNDPQLNREAKALIKRKYPNLQIPDYDLESRVEERLKADKEEREKEAEKRKQEEEDARFERERKRVQSEYGFTEEAMKDLEKLMIEKNIGDYDAAATYKASKTPKPSEATYTPSTWNHEKSDTFKNIAKDPEAWAREEIMGAITRDEQAMRGR